MTYMPGRPLLFLLSILAAGCAGESGDAPEPKDDALVGRSDPHANPTSPRIPDAWLDRARSRTLVAVAGANAGSQIHDWLARGWGTREAPFHRVQSLEAVTAILELEGDGRDVIYGWGWGPEVDPTREYAYRAISGKTYKLTFISRDVVATGYGDLTKFGESSVKEDAEALRGALDASEALRGRELMLVGCSWGGAVLDYGKTRTRERTKPSSDDASILGATPTFAIAAPKDLPSRLQLWPFVSLDDDGDYGTLLVRRRPDDAVGSGGLRPLLARFAGPTHNYTLVWHHDGEGRRVNGGFWGISGPGKLCPAEYDDDCPWEE